MIAHPVFGRICNPTVCNIGIYNPAMSVVLHFKCLCSFLADCKSAITPGGVVCRGCLMAIHVVNILFDGKDNIFYEKGQEIRTFFIKKREKNSEMRIIMTENVTLCAKKS